MAVTVSTKLMSIRHYVVSNTLYKKIRRVNYMIVAVCINKCTK